VRGLGVARGVVALPNASRRLNLGDDARVGAFAARFAGTPCLVLDPGARLIGDRSVPVGEWRSASGVIELTERGARPWEVA
ncbi:MAG: hypothetical protein R3F49_20080, partial [Planctomycetota bacterium]